MIYLMTACAAKPIASTGPAPAVRSGTSQPSPCGGASFSNHGHSSKINEPVPNAGRFYTGSHRAEHNHLNQTAMANAMHEDEARLLAKNLELLMENERLQRDLSAAYAALHELITARHSVREKLIGQWRRKMPR